MNKIYEQIHFYIDESYRDNFLGVAIVVMEGKENLKITKEALSSVSNDPVFKHRNSGSGEIHYAENNSSPKANILDQIYQMPISAYLSYRKQNTSSLIKEQMDEIAYKELFPELLRRVSTKYKKIFNEQPVTIHLQFEQLSNKKETDKLFFSECIAELNFNFEIQVVSKDDPLTALPDYFLGLLGSLTQESPQNWAENEFDIVEGKIGLIVDATGPKRSYYSRGDEIRDFIKALKA